MTLGEHMQHKESMKYSCHVSVIVPIMLDFSKKHHLHRPGTDQHVTAEISANDAALWDTDIWVKSVLIHRLDCHVQDGSLHPSLWSATEIMWQVGKIATSHFQWPWHIALITSVSILSTFSNEIILDTAKYLCMKIASQCYCEWETRSNDKHLLHELYFLL